MKILLATYWVLPHVGGVWTYIQNLKKYLELQGHEVDVFSRHPDGQSYHIENKALRIEKKRFEEIVADEIRNIYSSYQTQAEIDPWIIEQEIELCTYSLAAAHFGLKEYDLIHTQDIISSRGIKKVKPKHIPMISTIHGCIAGEYWISLQGSQPQASLWRYACAREYYGTVASDLTIVPSQWLRNSLSGFLVPSEHMKVIPYGVNIELLSQKMNDPPTFTIPPNKHIITCLARIDPVKGHRYLLEALNQLKNVRTDWVCLIIGDGDLRAEMEFLTTQWNLSAQVYFAGKRSDVPVLLKQSDIIVLPSIYDNLPFVVMEAQIAKKPILATDAGGIPEMIQHGYTGLLAQAGNSQDLFEKLLTLLSNPVYRENLATNGYHWGIEQWSLEKMIQRTFQLYTEIANKQYKRVIPDLPTVPRKIDSSIKSILKRKLKIRLPATFSIVDEYVIGSLVVQNKSG